MYAVFLDRNKQYLARKEALLTLDFLKVKIGDIFIIKDVVMFVNDKNMTFGSPFLNNISVKLKVVKHFKDKKIDVIKFKRRKNYIKRMGHRQNYTIVKVISIN